MIQIENEEKPMSKILVVDDSSTVRDEVAGFLKKNGLAVDTAVDGKDGLAKIKANPGLKLVISDVNMPNMDGLTMVEKVRGELGNKTVNVIMLTTESSPAMKDRGKAAGVKGWIVKPFKGDAVLETFKKLAS
ncbi:response regulator receiver protein [Ralstonia sp. NT80]|nr:response regulator receiver protein [Ralstonia sp. NT80]